LKGSSSRPAEHFDGGLPQALGQSLTPSHIKIQANANQAGEKKQDALASTALRARGDVKYSPAERHQPFQGSSQHPDNVGLVTSPVNMNMKIIRVNQARNQKGTDVAAKLEANLKKNTIQNQLQSIIPSLGKRHANKFAANVGDKQGANAQDKMAETLGMRSIVTGLARMTGQTMNLVNHQNSETPTSRQDAAAMSHGGVGYTPSIMSPIKHGTGIGLGLGENTLYSMPSPLTGNPIHRHDPVRPVEENIREQHELLEKRLNQRSKQAVLHGKKR